MSSTAPILLLSSGKTEFTLGADTVVGGSALLQPDGSIVVVGAILDGTKLDFGLARFLANGSLDTSFQNGGTAFGTGDDIPFAALLQPDGKIVVVGRTDNPDHTTSFALARYNTDGSLDTSFGSGGKVISPLFEISDADGVVLQPDGKILVVGRSIEDNPSGPASNFAALARYNIDGTLDVTFGSGGVVFTDDSWKALALKKVLLTSDGQIIEVGDTEISRYNGSDGSLDFSFGTDGKIALDGTLIVDAATLQSDGKIIIAGADDFNHFLVVRYNPDGSPDTSFGNGGSVKTAVNVTVNTVAEVKDVAVQLNGQIVVAGTSADGFTVVRYNPNGSLDTTFGPDHSGVASAHVGFGDDEALGLAIQPDGSIVVSGESIDPTGPEGRLAVVRFNYDGTLDLSFNSLDGRATYTEGGAPTVLDPHAAVSDPALDAANYNGASITLTRQGGARLDDVFAGTSVLQGDIHGGSSPLTEGSDLVVFLVGTVGTVTKNSAGTLMLTFNQNATQAIVNEVLQNITYSYPEHPVPAFVQIDWTFDDGGSVSGTGLHLQSVASTGVTIIHVNTPPVVTTTAGTTSELERTPVVVDPGVTVSDLDHFTLPSATVSITNHEREDQLSFTNTDTAAYGDIHGFYNPFTGTLTLSSDDDTATLAQWQEALRHVTYTDTSHAPDPTARQIEFVVNDSEDDSAPASKDVQPIPVNDAPSFKPGFVGGIVTTDIAGFALTGYGLALQSNGEIVAEGRAQDDVSFKSEVAVIRYTPGGALDPSFGTGGEVVSQIVPDSTSLARSVALQSDGKIVVAAYTVTDTGDLYLAVRRYDTDGSLDSTFGINGTVLTPLSGRFADVTSVAIQADGKIVVAAAQDNALALFRYNNVDGSLDTTFGTGGEVKTTLLAGAEALSVKIGADGKIVASGWAYNNSANLPNGTHEFAVARYNPSDGSLDTSFGGTGTVTTALGPLDDEAHALAVLPDGKVIAAGFTYQGFVPPNAGPVQLDGVFGLARYNADGTLDSTFGSGGKVITPISTSQDPNAGDDPAFALAVQSDGKVVVAGFAADPTASPNPFAVFAIVRYNTDGTLDDGFGEHGEVTIPVGYDAEAYSVAIQPDGKIVVLGFRSILVDANSDSAQGFMLVRLNGVDGSLDATFGAPTYFQGGSPVVLDANSTASDPELGAANDYAGASLTVERHGGASADDVFGATGNLSLAADHNVVLSGVTIGTWGTPQGPGTLTLTFNDNATQAVVEEAAHSLTYANTSSQAPSLVTIDWILGDGNTGAQGIGGELFSHATTTVNIVGGSGTGAAPAPSISVAIGGTAQEGRTLTAQVAGAASDDALTYQWRSGGTNVANATSSTYLVAEGDETGTISVVVTDVADNGGGITTASNATAGTVIDATPSITLAIAGTAQEGQMLTAQVSGAESDDALTYQWQSAGSNIANATSSTYLVAEGDEAKTISVVVTDVADNGGGTTTAGNTTGTVIDAAPSITVAIGGSAREGQTLTAQVSDAASDDALTYQWQSGGANIANATSSTYVVAESDEGKTVAVVVTDIAGNSGGTTTASNTTGTVADAAPSISVAIGGTAQEGRTLIAQVSSAESDDALTYQWQRGGTNIANAAASTYLVVETDEAKTITVVVTDTADASGGVITASNTTGTVIDAAPSISVSIGGTAQEDATLTAKVLGAESDDALSYQWRSGGANVANATSSTYLVAEGDEARTISVVVTDTADNNGGTTTASSATGTVIDVAPGISVSVSGNAQQGQTLSAQVSGAESDDTLSYQWQSGGANIAGATSSTYLVAESDEAKTISVMVTDVADNSGGTTTASSSTGTVTDITPALTAVTIATSANPGTVLTAVGGIPNDSDATVTYQWWGGGAPIANATSSTYQVQASDEGNQLQVVVTSHDTDGGGTTVFSNGTSPVTGVLSPPAVTSFTPDAGVQGDFTTTASNITLSGTARQNVTVDVFDGSSLIGEVASDGSGNWSLFAQGLANGTHNFTAEMVSGGQASAASSIFAVTIDPNAPDHAPVVSVANFNVTQDQAVPVATAANLSVTDADGNPIAQYQFFEAPGSANDGYYLINGAAQPTGQPISVDAGNLASVLFEGGAFAGAGGSDLLYVRAFDGQRFSDWVSFTATSTAHAPRTGANQLPVVNVANLTAPHGKVYTGNQLVSAGDTDGDSITKYQFWDAGRPGGPNPNPDPSAGYFLLNGQQEPEGRPIEVTAAQLGSISFQTASGANLLYARAYDGFAWGDWAPFTVTAPADNGPTAVASNHAINKGASIAGSALVSASDSDGDGISSYQFFDGTPDQGSGYFVLNGTGQVADTVITVGASQFASFSFHSGPGVGGTGSSDDLFVRAADSLGIYGAWQEFHITAANQAPVVVGTNVNLGGSSSSVALSAMFTASDPDGDPLTLFQLLDSTSDANSGYFDVNGVVEGTNQGIFVSPADFSHTVFVKGTDSTTLTEWMRAYDGAAWSAWTSITLTESANAPPPGNTPATVPVHDINVTSTGQTFAASSLASASDGDGDTITRYQFFDAGGDATPLGAIGHFVLNGEILGENQPIDIAPLQLGSLTFDSGQGSALEFVRAFDGFQWSAWQSFHVNAPVDAPPTVNAANANLAENQMVAASSLFSASDHAGATIQNYDFWQRPSSTGAHFAINGAPVAGFNHEINVAASQLSQATFQTGSSPGSDTLFVRANDGVVWSDWQQVTVATHA